MNMWSEKDAALTLARLHMSGGKRHLQEGCLTAGLIALYDAVLFGMRHYIAKHGRCIGLAQNVDLWDPAELFQELARSGVFEDRLTFNRFSLTVERALWQESFLFDTKAVLAVVEEILTKLRVIPFDESVLPSETPMTIKHQVNEDVVR